MKNSANQNLRMITVGAEGRSKVQLSDAEDRPGTHVARALHGTDKVDSVG